MRHEHSFEAATGRSPAPAGRRITGGQSRWMSAARTRAAGVTGVILGMFWQVLHWGDPASWIVGGPAVVGGAAVAAVLPEQSGPGIRLSRVPGFACNAAWGVLLGAVDVGLQSLRPEQLHPAVIRFDTTLPDGAPRRALALLITMMPGTLTARLDGARLDVHAIDHGPRSVVELRRLELQVARLYGADVAGGPT